MECPKCKQEMETGYIFGSSYAGASGMKWSEEVKGSYIGGEDIPSQVKKRFSGVYNISAHRCSSCRMILIEY